MPRSGLETQTTGIFAAWSRSMTPFQPERSAKAPCTSTTVSSSDEVSLMMDLPDWLCIGCSAPLIGGGQAWTSAGMTDAGGSWGRGPESDAQMSSRRRLDEVLRGLLEHDRR